MAVHHLAFLHRRLKLIKEKYRIEGQASTRFVKKGGPDFYKWCEQSLTDPRYDIAQGTCDTEDLPLEILEKCKEYTGSHYACEWPL